MDFDHVRLIDGDANLDVGSQQSSGGDVRLKRRRRRRGLMSIPVASPPLHSDLLIFLTAPLCAAQKKELFDRIIAKHHFLVFSHLTVKTETFWVFSAVTFNLKFAQFDKYLCARVWSYQSLAALR